MNSLSAEDFARQVMLRLWPDGTRGLTVDSAAGWLDVAPGLVQTLVLDEPNGVRTIAPNQAARVGEGFLLEAARNNLAQIPYQRHIVGWQDLQIDILRSDSSYAASQLLVLAELLAQMYPDRVASSGVLIAVPDRSMMMVHIVNSGTGGGVLAAMRRYAHDRHGHAPWPLSAHVYWWHDGDLSIAGASRHLDSPERVTDETYAVFERAVSATEPSLRPTAVDVAARETDRPVIDVEQFAPSAREVLVIALELCAEQITGGIKDAAAFSPFVVMGTRNDFHLVLINRADALPASDPFLYMRKFMTTPNQFAMMAVAGRFNPADPKVPYNYIAVVQIEHEANISVRVAIPYRITESGDPRFGPASPNHLVPADWPVWNQGLETTP